MGKKVAKCKKKPVPRQSKEIRKPLRDLPPSRCNQFDETLPIGLAWTFQVQKKQALDLFVQPEREIKFRDKEIRDIDNFVEEFIDQRMRGCRFLMVTGGPGLGKSTSVDLALQNTTVRVIKINGDHVKSLNEVQAILAQQILAIKKFDSSTRQLFSRLATWAQVVQPTIVRIKGFGELLRNNVNDYSRDFLSLFSMKEVRLALIGVGGSMEDLDRFARKAQCLQQSFRNVFFHPYSRQSITSIIRERFQTIADDFHFKITISEKVIELAVNKLLLITNDVRVMLNHLQKIIMGKLENYERTLPIFAEADDYENWVFSIEPEDLDAIKKVEVQKAGLAGSLPEAQQIILLAMDRVIAAEDLLYLSDEQTLLEAKQSLFKAHIPTTYDQIKLWLREIENYGLIKMERKGPKTRIMMMVGSEDLKQCQQTEKKLLQMNPDECLAQIDNLC